MKTQNKSNERLLALLNSVKTLIEQGQPVNFSALYKAFKISRATGTYLQQLGIILKNGNERYEWIGENPSIEMCNKIKQYHKDVFKGDLEQDSDNSKDDFSNLQIDEKLNHLNFMIDQVFDRVNYLFENLADKSIKDKTSADWFKK